MSRKRFKHPEFQIFSEVEGHSAFSIQLDCRGALDKVERFGDVMRWNGYRIVAAEAEDYGQISAMAFTGFCKRAIKNYLKGQCIFKWAVLFQHLKEPLGGAPWTQGM